MIFGCKMFKNILFYDFNFFVFIFHHMIDAFEVPLNLSLTHSVYSFRILVNNLLKCNLWSWLHDENLVVDNIECHYKS